MEKLRIGVVGTGHLGALHTKIYSSLKKRSNIELVGVCDIRKKVAKEVSRKYNTKFYTNYRDMLGKVDAVSIVVPTSLHFEVAKYFLSSGVHVLVEKPITKNLEEADKLLEIAEKKGLILQVGHIERFNSAIRSIEKLLKNPRFIECQRLGSIKTKKRIKDVGVVLDLMIHDIDIILGLVHSKVRDIEAVGLSTVSEHEDLANVRLSFQNNVIADITASRVTKEEVRKIRIFQDDSYILLDFLHCEAFLYKGGNEHAPKKEKIRIRKKNALKVELKSFINCVRDNKRPLVSGYEGRQALSVALDILEKIKSPLLT